jgi:hypothetical protein
MACYGASLLPIATVSLIRRVSSAGARIQAWVSPCGNCGGQSCTGTGFWHSISGLSCWNLFSNSIPTDSFIHSFITDSIWTWQLTLPLNDTLKTILCPIYPVVIAIDCKRSDTCVLHLGFLDLDHRFVIKIQRFLYSCTEICIRSQTRSHLCSRLTMTL